MGPAVLENNRQRGSMVGGSGSRTDEILLCTRRIASCARANGVAHDPTIFITQTNLMLEHVDFSWPRRARCATCSDHATPAATRGHRGWRTAATTTPSNGRRTSGRRTSGSWGRRGSPWSASGSSPGRCSSLSPAGTTSAGSIGSWTSSIRAESRSTSPTRAPHHPRGWHGGTPRRCRWTGTG